MFRKIRQLDFDRVRFSQASLLRIQLTIHETLCRYLDQDDPHDHELQFGTVSELLDVLEQFEAPYLRDRRGVIHILGDIRKRVDRFLELLSSAPLANTENMEATLGAIRRIGLEPSFLNLRVYEWDLWELRALAVGAPPFLAEIGRGALRRQHFSEHRIQEMEPELLLFMVTRWPQQAEMLFRRLLAHGSTNDFPNFNWHCVNTKIYS